MPPYRIIDKFVAICLLAALAGGAAGQEALPLAAPGGLPQAGPEVVSAEAVSSHVTVTAGQTFHVAVPVTIEDGWVFYSPEPVVTPDYEPIAAELRVEAGDLQVVEVRWPMDEFHPNADFGDSYAYEDRMVVYVALRVPPTAPVGSRPVRLTLDGQVCGELCILAVPSASVEVVVGSKDATNPAWTGELAEGLGTAVSTDELRDIHKSQPSPDRPLADMTAGPDYSLAGGLALAVLAGLILNVMPCVLPVIPIRILTIVDAAGDSRRRFVTLGLAFAAGVLAFFVGVAVVNMIAKLAFEKALPWASHFDYPAFRIGMALLLVALAANLFGAFHVVVPRNVAGLETKVTAGQAGHLRAAGMGLMLAVLATPCSFATLIGVLGWAQGKTLAVGTGAMVLVGVGMAAPHALLAAFPKLIDYLPKPGRWMELLRQGMGFAVLGVAVWLFSTVAGDGGGYAIRAIGYGVVLAFGLWVWGTWVRYDAPLTRKMLIRGLATALVVGAGWGMLRPQAEAVIDFQPFDRAVIEKARDNGRPVLVKFTASWCISCKKVEKEVYRNRKVADALAEADVLPMVADVSDRGTPANKYLYDELGANGVPLTVIFATNGRLIALPGKF
ncbi:MAG: protein-disulfide reductase DsbD family protein [Planctomycetota bacterium]|jgi:thiol:disulfide interchange protein